MTFVTAYFGLRRIFGANSPRRTSRGSSLFEMLIVLMLMAILAKIAAPSMFSTSEVAKRDNAIRSFEFDIARLRTEALSSGVRALMNTANSGSTYIGGIDVLPYAATVHMDQQVFSSSLPDGITVNFADTIIFDSRGFPVDDIGQSTTYTAAFTSHGEHFCDAAISVSGSIAFSCKENGV
jgi:Tfp pilus assembly protein FimT